MSVDLHIGAVDYIRDDDVREASCLRASGNDTLVLGYTVQAAALTSSCSTKGTPPSMDVKTGREQPWHRVQVMIH